MKIQINRTQLMLTELLQEVVASLYNRNPVAQLIHADFDLTEANPYDSVNSMLYVSGKFSVSVSPIIKVELCININFLKTENDKRGWRRNVGVFRVSHPESGESVNMDNYNEKAVVWDDRDGENFRFLIGNPK